MIEHGGDVWQVSEESRILATELLDFSANINPRGLPARARDRLARDAADPHLLGLYPDPSARHLRAVLGEQLCVPADAVAVGPGAEALLAPILRVVKPRRALVPVPAFGEYSRVCSQEQVVFTPFPLDRWDSFRLCVDRFCEDIRPGDLVVLNNPHNPSGAMMELPEVRRVLEATSAVGATLLLDEAFIDYVAHASLVQEAATRPGLIVLRSLTKFYGCPALRVGFAVAGPDAVLRIRSFLPTWPVTQLAMSTLAEAVADRAFKAASLLENSIERARLAHSLSKLGLVVFPSAANYLFLELGGHVPAASELRARLIANHRILIRNCDSYAGLAPGPYIRVAVRTAAENCALIQALSCELNRPGESIRTEPAAEKE